MDILQTLTRRCLVFALNRLLSAVTRVELIGSERQFVDYDVETVSVRLQDDGRTLKIFVEHDGV